MQSSFFLCGSDEAVSGKKCWERDDDDKFIPSIDVFPCIPDKDTCSLDAFCNIAVLSGQHLRVIQRLEELRDKGATNKRELRGLLAELLTKTFDSLTVDKKDKAFLDALTR